MNAPLDTLDKLNRAKAKVELLFMAAGDLDRMTGAPLRIGAMEVSDLVSEVAAVLKEEAA